MYGDADWRSQRQRSWPWQRSSRPGRHFNRPNGAAFSRSHSQRPAQRATESARAANLAGQQTQVDIGIFLRWISAADDDIRSGLIERPTEASAYDPTVGTVSGFIYERMRDEFRPALDAWLDTDPFGNPDAPATPFVMSEYQLEASARAEELQALAELRSADGIDDNQQADDYVLMAVIFASVLFLVGLSSKLANPKSGLAILMVGIVLFVGGAVTLLTFPIQI